MIPYNVTRVRINKDSKVNRFSQEEFSEDEPIKKEDLISDAT